MRLQKFSDNATLTIAGERRGAHTSTARLLASLSLITLLVGCGSAPPAPPRQLQEYHRHTSVGLEKYRDGQIGEARNAFLRALARAELDDDSRLIATALLNLGAAELLLDHAAEAGQAYGRASREARLAGAGLLDWQAISGLAESARRLGQPAKALDLFAARPDVGKDLAPAIRLPAEVSRARALADGGQSDTALTLLDTLIAEARKQPQPDPALAAALHARASVMLARGNPGAARESALAALDLDRHLHHPPSVADDHHLLATIAAVQNDLPTARHHQQRAFAIFSNTGQEKRATGSANALKPGTQAK